VTWAPAFSIAHAFDHPADPALVIAAFSTLFLSLILADANSNASSGSIDSRRLDLQHRVQQDRAKRWICCPVSKNLLIGIAPLAWR
jgi:hypothetical protein